MNLPDIESWSAGSAHDETTFNAVSDALNFLLNPPEAKVVQTAAQSIPNGTATATPITWSSVVFDNDDMWDSSTPTILTIQTPGWYEVEWALAFAGRADALLRSGALYLNGVYSIASAIAYNDFINDGTTATPEMWLSYDYFFNTGDTVALGALQNSGSSLNTASSSSDALSQTFLRLRWASL